MSMFALATTSCDKDATEVIFKTEHNVVILVESYRSDTALVTNGGKSNYYDYNKGQSIYYLVTGKTAPLEGVAIKFLDIDKTLTTDAKGKVSVTLPAGNYRVSIKKDGYTYYKEYSYYDSEGDRQNSNSETPTTFGADEYITLSVGGNGVEKIMLALKGK